VLPKRRALILQIDWPRISGARISIPFALTGNPDADVRAPSRQSKFVLVDTSMHGDPCAAIREVLGPADVVGPRRA
jgi:hypothetical protein